jgi:hypothetical protein
MHPGGIRYTVDNGGEPRSLPTEVRAHLALSGAITTAQRQVRASRMSCRRLNAFPRS